MAYLQAKNLSKTYGDGTDALVNLNLSAEKGELTVIVGPSGCGKSTALRILAGLEEASGGSFHLNGRDLSNVPPQKRNTSLMFQHFTLFPHYSIRENIVYGLRIRKEPESSIKKKLEEITGALNIKDILDRNPGEVSGGQQQRAALARALIREPDLVLLDEPLSNLDAMLRTQMRHEIRSLQQQRGSSMVYVTHDQTEALTMADRLVILDHGVVQQAGTPVDVYEDPDNTFVASFLGNPGMNLVPGKLNGQDRNGFLAGKTEFHLESPGPDTGSESMILGIRPEHMVACTAQDSVVQEGCPITAIENMGGYQLVYFTVGDTTWILRNTGKPPAQDKPLYWKFCRQPSFFDKSTRKTIRQGS